MRQTLAPKRTTVAVIAAVLIVVAVGALLYFGGIFGGGQKFSVSGLQISHGLVPFGAVSFNLTNHNSLPISSVSVSVNQSLASPRGTPVSSSNPISPNQSMELLYVMQETVVSGQSYPVQITVTFGDGSMASYSATVTAL